MVLVDAAFSSFLKWILDCIVHACASMKAYPSDTIKQLHHYVRFGRTTQLSKLVLCNVSDKFGWNVFVKFAFSFTRRINPCRINTFVCVVRYDSPNLAIQTLTFLDSCSVRLNMSTKLSGFV